MSNRQSSIARAPKPAFTLVELLVVIFIIAVLVGILIPVVGRVRRSAKSAATQQTIATISGAIDRFYQDWHRYPGPIPNAIIHTSSLTVNTSEIATYDTTWDATKITGTENLVLELLGGLKYDAGTGNTYYDPTLVGAGAMKPNDAQHRRIKTYLEPSPEILSWRLDSAGKKTGRFQDDAGQADDTIIPEFVDNFNSPLPILYIRSNAGATDIAYNSDVTPTPIQQYDLAQIKGYTGSNIGVGMSPAKDFYNNNTKVPSNPAYHGLKTVNSTATMSEGAGYYYPYDLYPYLTNPAIANTPRNKDGFILISAGPDRIYGTDDDICNFGSVK